MTEPPAFPAGFRWGTATAAYQIEGAATADGRAPSIWDTFTHSGDTITDDSTGDTACDHYHRYPEDIALLARLGVDAYRFSVAWPRVQPTGAGPVNPAGIGFYDKLVDGLLGAGVDPVVTLFHWDLPQARQDEGGWTARDTAARFADYAGLVAAALGDRVKLWITLNEPAVHLVYGHLWGMHAPGLNLFDDPFPVAHHQLLAHGWGTAAIRAAVPGARVAIANSYSPGWAVGEDGERSSATDADRTAVAAYDAFYNRLFTDPILLGRYPDELAAFTGSNRLIGGAEGDRLPDLIEDGDMAAIAAPIDALGVNYYNPAGVSAPTWAPLPYEQRLISGYPLTYFGWPVVPDSLRELLVDLRDRYGDRLPPIHITENGCAYEDVPEPDGSIVDKDRIAYLDAHIRAVADAIAAGVPVEGYYVWSLLDNFEWAEGYTKRFGLVYVDYPTQRRTPKASYDWYRRLIAAGRT